MPEPKQSALIRSIGGEGDGGPSENMQEYSHDANEEVGQNDGFRMEVDLSAYFETQAHCILWVVMGGDQSVRGLAQRLQREAGLRKPFCMMCGVYALPLDEPLCLLRPGDTLRVVPVDHKWQRAFGFGYNETADETDSISQPGPTAVEKKTRKRRKRDSVEITSEPLVAAESQSETVPPLSLPESSPQPTCIEDEALQRVKQRALALIQEVQGSWEGDDSTKDERAPAKRRRHRVRKRRAPLPVSFEAETVVEPKSMTATEPEPITVTEQELTPAVTASPQVAAVMMSPTEVLRNACTPRAPRLVRALNTSETQHERRIENDHCYYQTNNADHPPTPHLPPLAPTPPAVQCN